MKKIIICLLVFSPLYSFCQFGIKAGLNFANVTQATTLDNKIKSGFHAGVFLAPPFNNSVGFRTELLYSKQGYKYETKKITGTVDLNYIMSANFLTISLTKFFQIQAGFQTAYLLNASADSSNLSGGNTHPYGQIIDFYKRIDYGLGGGVEMHPFGGLLIGARMNISLGNLYKDALKGQLPTFSNVDIKNNLFQIFTGWKFGQDRRKKY